MSVLYIKIPQILLRELFFPLGYNGSRFIQWVVYVGGLGFVLDFGLVFVSLQSVCSADSFHLTSLSCDSSGAFAQVKFSLRLNVLYLSGPSILSPAPVFRERPMWEPVSLHFFWWFILARLVLTFRIITPPVMSNELGQFSDRRHLSDISLLLLKKCSDFCGLGPLHRHCRNTKT